MTLKIVFLYISIFGTYLNYPTVEHSGFYVLCHFDEVIPRCTCVNRHVSLIVPCS